MGTFRLATFNCENLFARYKFNKNFDPYVHDGFEINDTAFDILGNDEKKITAKAILETDADIICLQEVESLPVLDRFVSQYLAKARYSHRVVIDSFDPRQIDVALLSRIPVENIRTHRHEKRAKSSVHLFSRDCLEVDFKVESGIFTVYINHFKSMMGGRDETAQRRREQAERVLSILHARYGDTLEGRYAVLGDLNDYLEPPSSIEPLVKHPGLINVVELLPAKDQWTHFYDKEGEYRQLDYILLPKEYHAGCSSPHPDIVRMGLPYRATRYTGQRFDGVGENKPKASDHCPLAITLR